MTTQDLTPNISKSGSETQIQSPENVRNSQIIKTSSHASNTTDQVLRSGDFGLLLMWLSVNVGAGKSTRAARHRRGRPSWLEVAKTVVLAAVVYGGDVEVSLALKALEGNLALDDIVLVSVFAFLDNDVAG